jgi:Protein of unknown function (DUF3892)
MNVEPTPVKLKLANIHCFDEGDSAGSAEPYLWTVFFKIDGDTAHVDSSLTLQGTATVVTTPGNHGNLGAHDVDAGDDVPIPPELGEFSTVLTPIPVDGMPDKNISGVIGCIAILLEEDETPAHAVAQGHEVLNQAVQTALDELIPTLNVFHQSPTDADIKALTDKIGKHVEDAISDDVSVWEWLTGFGNEDDKIGTKVFYASQNDICKTVVVGIPLSEEWRNEGHWTISGRLGAVGIDELEVTCIHKPTGNAEAHHIDHLGGVFNGQPWRLTNTEVMGYIQTGIRFHVRGADGSRSEVEVQQHWKSKPNPTGRYLTTVPDATKANNLLSLPTC